MQQYRIQQTEQGGSYPCRLLSIAKPPVRLYYRGAIEVINQNRNIAVIGSRRMSEQGIKLAVWTGYELGRRGINVVNGLALGCDTYALQGTLAAGGACVAVMPCGLDQVVPHSNNDLADKLLAGGGCLLSEYPARTPARRYQYVERDRLQSGISDGVIVIEAECDSGTMHTVRYAIKQGRRLACIDSSMVMHSSGNQWLERQNGVNVIRDIVDLKCFIDGTDNEMVYRQTTLDTFVSEGDFAG